MLQFSLADVRGAFSSVCTIQYFPVFAIVCQCLDSDTDSDSDCELAYILRVVVASLLNAFVFMHVLYVFF